jgi:hypothetical protein
VTEQQFYVVKVRVKGYTWTSHVMAHDDARAWQRDLRRDIPHLGPGCVEFRATGGREAAIRADHITAVEVAPWHDPNPPTPAEQATVTGTDWLRQHAAHDHVHAALSGGTLP